MKAPLGPQSSHHAGLFMGEKAIWLDSTTMSEAARSIGNDSPTVLPEGIAVAKGITALPDSVTQEPSVPPIARSRAP